MKPLLIDTHAHLDMPEFDKDRNEVIARALNSGIIKIITVGIDLASSQKAIELAKNRREIAATVGIHPHEAAWVSREDIARLATLSKQTEVVALGEMGLDYYRHRSPQEAQLRVLKWQLELATETGLPIIIHCRQADTDMVRVLKEWTSQNKYLEGQELGVIHCFSSDREIACKYLDMGFYISFGAYIGYPSSMRLQEAIRSIPHDRLLIETDCPFLPPQAYRGKRNEPSYVATTANLLADIRQEPVAEIARVTTQNASRLFSLKLT